MPRPTPKSEIPRLPHLRLALGGDYGASVRAACSVGVAPLAICCSAADMELLAELLPEKGRAVQVHSLYDLQMVVAAVVHARPHAKPGVWVTKYDPADPAFPMPAVPFTDIVLVNFTALSRLAADTLGNDLDYIDYEGATAPRIPTQQQPAAKLFGDGGVWDSTRLSMSRVLADLFSLPVNVVATCHLQTAESDRGEPGERSLSAIGWGKRQSGDPWAACGLVTADDEKESGYSIRFSSGRNDFMKAPPSWPVAWADSLGELAGHVFKQPAAAEAPVAQPEQGQE